MAIPTLARDFKEFLKLLNSNKVEYLLIGGYAVGIHGYIRTTNDLGTSLPADYCHAASRGRAALRPAVPAWVFFAVAAIPAAGNFAIRLMSLTGTGFVSEKWTVPLRSS